MSLLGGSFSIQRQMFACLLSGIAVVAADVPPRPNLLFMMADQMRWDSLSIAAGAKNKAAHTPALDRLAHEGVLVQYATSSTPTCTPARAALLTGRSPWNHGMLGYGEIAPRYALELPRVLADAGYHTKSIGKNHFGWNATSDSGVGHGFQSTSLYDGLGKWSPSSKHSWAGEWDDYDQWFARQAPGLDPQATLDSLDGDGWNGWHGRPYVYNESLHPTAWVGRQAVDFIKSYPNASATTPFMLKVSFHRPHSPYDPPQRVLDTVHEKDLPPFKLCKAAAAGSTSTSGDSWCLRFRGMPGDPEGCGPTADAWCGLMPENDTVLSRRAYTASIKFVDEWVGHIYDSLVDRNLLERTWILWTSDHGDGQGDMFHWRKGFPYEFSAHVPMLLRWPQTWASAQPSGSILARGTQLRPPIVTELRDVFHTFVDAAGIASNASLVPPRGSAPKSRFAVEDGKSLLCLLRDPTGTGNCDYPPNPGPWRSWIDMEHSVCYNMTNHWSALTDGQIKYVFRAWAGDEQLFNLTSDPDEKVEVSGLAEYSAVLSLWRQRLVRQFESEGRGKDWVQDGRLMKRTKSTNYSPNYPGKMKALESRGDDPSDQREHEDLLV